MPDTLTRSYNLDDRDLLFSEPQDGYVLRVRDMPDDMRPRERLLELGPGNLSVAELVAIIWGVGNRKEDVLAMAKRTLKEYGDKAISSELSPQRLAETADIPLTKACQVIAGFELGRRFYAQQGGRSVQVRNAKQAYRYLKDMGTSQKEQLRGLYLNSRYQVIHDEVISIGTLTSNVVHPREVFQPAIERGAVAIVLAHNHPSGRLEPTMPDIRITEQLIKAGDVLGIELLDHLVITSGKYTSVMECIDQED
ncbi:MAG TPA: DNA repair protein RadC [Candidatus Saccharimonadales bacterium]